MTVESATYIDGLVPANTNSSSPATEGDNHIALIKTVLQNTFPSISGVVSANEANLGTLSGQTSNVSTQFSALSASISTNASSAVVNSTNISTNASSITANSTSISTNASTLTAVSTAVAAISGVDTLTTVDLTAYGSGNVDITSLSSAKSIRILLSGCSPTADANAFLRVSTDAGSSFISTSSYYTGGWDAGGSLAFQNASTRTSFPINEYINSQEIDSAGDVSGFIDLIGLDSGSVFWSSMVSYIINGGTKAMAHYMGYIAAGADVDAIRIGLSTGQWDAGKVVVLKTS